MIIVLRKIHADLYCGLSFFTRLPVQWLYRSDFPFSFGRAIWTWPWIGLIIGLIISIIFKLTCHLIPSAWIIAFLILGIQFLLTGGLHEDGLADMADGFGGGKNKEHKLEIMRDSRLGSYGVLTLFIILGLQVSALSFLARYNTTYATMVLIITAVLSRISILLPICCSQPARYNGLASSLVNIPRSSILIAILSTLLLIFALTPWMAAIVYIILSALISAGITLYTQKHIEGYTGDILGAIQTLVATGILITSTIFTV
ncbi:adenosylcobinamide-GDP ribazoletransferase [Commensalibacter papalotli (ex Botero et al. 2024)]|uniref:Adenosylcobinamide-GDP ribazoletransferase n=1 Tax=Commensalibacter papalotli (ex Botero et al. 2024) TaxID=2972766 RepID=A0ABN8WFZ4_9PROT|nr:adenosylcobinamide-GDP ribazoletransferase [Commensalibacter papalotli (ex Botero et al. 2024)]CAI3953855.1 Cobalamin synthase CobS (adenosylcobinamide-GDP ribazoletransferase) (CobS) (PUBMED:31481610) [Commensalibacter papalotli (ex Botero et al. 2024)]CAI3954374.1 Cobalamin synthase CobS (adenosylcobinamide-GDP ribazoletransferase) (CobS) (PUBMED:31481610) [Commensalibacter papalotli (ex Botero et al. 2024)]